MNYNPWRPANNGTGRRPWFLVRRVMRNPATDYHYASNGVLVRYATHESAARAAVRLNGAA
jgi:hypothetical protein